MRRIRRIAVTPTVGTAAYTALDTVGGKMTFAIADQGFDGLIRGVLLTDNANQKEPYTLYVFDAVPSTIADDASYAPTLADLKKLATTVAVGTADWATIAANTIAWAMIGGHEDGKMEQAVHSDNGDLYMYAAAVATPDYVAADDLTITLIVEAF